MQAARLLPHINLHNSSSGVVNGEVQDVKGEDRPQMRGEFIEQIARLMAKRCHIGHGEQYSIPLRV
jgi:hypothetical protein